MSKISRRQLDQLFDRHYAELVRYAKRFTVSQESAEDITQEAFIKLYQKPPDDPTKVLPWLRIVVQRLAFDEYRKFLQFQHHAEKWYSDDHREMVLSAEDEAFRVEASNQVNKVLAQLSDRDRRILLLRHAGYSYREIAERLQLEQTQVGMMILRAMKKFQALWMREDMWDERQNQNATL